VQQGRYSSWGAGGRSCRQLGGATGLAAKLQQLLANTNAQSVHDRAKAITALLFKPGKAATTTTTDKVYVAAVKVCCLDTHLVLFAATCETFDFRGTCASTECGN
jgi:hypothetical protein